MGKSTLLNMLSALDRPTSGSVWINGQNLSQIKNLDRFRARTVGFVFQMHNLIPSLKAIENIEVPMRGQKVVYRAIGRAPGNYSPLWAWLHVKDTCQANYQAGSVSE